MADLGKAYVQIVPSAEGISGSISSVLNKEASSAGTNAGGSIVDRIKARLAGTDMVRVAEQAGKVILQGLQASLNEGAALEQSIGGVETIFKGSSDTVAEYARTAYQRAGVSANEYMEQVTSFSASLLQSLGGNTEAAAQYADRAMVDMSDNANKFGTDMESIQNAYQGFAKQNYTMLDNLKLGYGGTKEEMQRLIQDASGMSDAMDKLGVSVDASDMSFGNIVNAISVVQEEMGISGTTALEASETFSGSFGSMKAAATNFLASLTGVTDESGEAVLSVSDSFENMVNSAITFIGGNLLPMVGNILGSLGTLVGEAVENLPVVAQNLPVLFAKIASWLVTNIPSFLVSAMQGLSSLITSLIQCIPSLLNGFVEGIKTFFTQTDWGAVASNILQLMASGFMMTIDIITALADVCMQLLETVNNIDWLQLGIDILTFIGNGIVSVATSLWETAGNIFTQAKDKIKTIDWLQLGKDVIQFIINGFLGLQLKILNTMLNIGSSLVNKFKESKWGQAGQEAINKIKNGVNNVKENLKNAFSNLKDQAKEKFKQGGWSAVGSWIIDGIVNGISSAAGRLFSSLKNMAHNALSTAKKALKIGSPSKAFENDFGYWIPEGGAKGVEKNNSLSQAVDKMAKDTIEQAQVSLGDIRANVSFFDGLTGNGTTQQDNSTVINQTINSAKALSPSEIAMETQAMMRRLKWA